MAKSVQTVDKTETGNKTPVFKFENDGDTIKGEILGLGQYNGQYGKVVVLTVQTPEGPRRVYGRGTMDKRLRDLRPEVGDIIEISQIGEKVSAEGNTYMKFTVRVLPW